MTPTVDKYRAYAAQLVRDPDDPATLVNQFAVVSQARQHGRHYLPLAKRAYTLAPNAISAVFNYGSALHRIGRFEEALALYQRCVDIADDDWRAKCLHHVGVTLRALGRNDEAIDYYTKAHAIDPNPAYLKDRALAMLAAGRLRDGLREFEVRREVALVKFAENRGELISQQKLPADAVHWQGEDLTGKRVVVYHEEGSGDFIQFCRFIPLLRARGAAAIHLAGPVENLLEFVADNIAVDGIVPLTGPFDCDYVVGSMSLPWRCGVDYDQVDGRPYFCAEPARLPKRGVLNVGLVWRGNPAYGMDVHRSMAFAEFTSLFDLPGVAFHSLQTGPAGLEVTELGFDGFVANLEPFMTDWRSTARLITALDVVVSVDTACAHLACALGKPVLILTTNASDWRWDRESERTVWYDSARVIRQAQQDVWAPCVARVRGHLQHMLEERR